MLDSLIPAPRLLELDHIDLAAPPGDVWQHLRHGELAPSPLVRALFALRTLPERVRGKAVNTGVRLDDLRSSEERPGFQILAEAPPRELAAGAVGKVWRMQIPFVHVPDAKAFAVFDEPGFIKVAWALRALPLGEDGCRVEVEVRVSATDEASWRKFQRYFRVIGPGSRFIRRTLLDALARHFGTLESSDDERALAGDELLPDAAVQITEGITVGATPEAVWPWLVQIGCRRAGFYAIDLLDNGNVRSARELHPELLSIQPGQILPATPDGEDGFEVLRVEPSRTLILGGLFDAAEQQQLAFTAPRPARYWHVTWAFSLEPLGARCTRLHVRARAAFPASERLRGTWMGPLHRFMQRSMLRHIAERVEGRLPRDDLRDVLDGLGGAALMLGVLLTPFLRRSRSHWGLDEESARRAYPGDHLVADPRWSWTHGVEIDAPAAEVWPWVAQIGADRGGFYSYQWLENLAGCRIQNAERVHPEWAIEEGQALQLHPAPNAPRLLVTALDPGRHFVAHAPPDAAARESGRAWVAASWLFLIEPLGPDRCRFISRYRGACSKDVATRLAFGPTLLEPVGFAMDRRMLLGVKERAERARRVASPLRTTAP